MIVRVRAGWVVPVDGPVLRGGWLDVDAGRRTILAVGAEADTDTPEPDRTLDLSEAVVLPGLVNAHTHLELSHLAGVVPPADGFVSWVRTLLSARAGAPADDAAIHRAIVEAIGAMEASGTAGVGDIGNTAAAVLPLTASSLRGVHFREALGFSAASAEAIAADTLRGVGRAHHELRAAGATRLAPSCAPHAPYSTSAPLIRALASGYAPGRAVSSIHLAESAEEIEFLATGGGPFRQLLHDLGAWDDSWQAPGTRPLAYLDGLGVLRPSLLVVHGTQLDRPELERLAEVGAPLVLCGRSNRWVGVGVPPVAAAFAAGVAVAVGTDSLASVEDLNLFAELRYLREVAPAVPARSLLHAATRGGARALGCHDLGYLGLGASSRAVVRVPPPAVDDVEEWLVSGAADTTDLRWLDVLVRHAVS